jgi:hypothetical protein
MMGEIPINHKLKPIKLMWEHIHQSFSSLLKSLGFKPAQYYYVSDTLVDALVRLCVGEKHKVSGGEVIAQINNLILALNNAKTQIQATQPPEIHLKLNVFQDKTGNRWATWLNPKFEDRVRETIVGVGDTPEESAQQFVQILTAATQAKTISIFKGNITLLDPKTN